RGCSRFSHSLGPILLAPKGKPSGKASNSLLCQSLNRLLSTAQDVMSQLVLWSTSPSTHPARPAESALFDTTVYCCCQKCFLPNKNDPVTSSFLSTTIPLCCLP